MYSKEKLSYCELINSLRNGTIVRCLSEHKKMSEKSVVREAWIPEMTSQSFPVSCFWSRGFVPHRRWNLTLLVHQNTGKENCYRIFLFATLISTLGRFNREKKKKKSVIYTLTRRPFLPMVKPGGKNGSTAQSCCQPLLSPLITMQNS